MESSDERNQLKPWTAMVVGNEERAIFVDSSLGTHLALQIPPHITAGELRCRLVREHYFCFPSLGKIKVHSLMVKRKSCYYHLPDSLPINNAFEGMPGSWFLLVDASCMQKMPRQEALEEEISFCGRKMFKLAPGTPFAPKKSMSSHFYHFQDKQSDLVAVPGNLCSKSHDSMTDANDVVDCSESKNAAANENNIGKAPALSNEGRQKEAPTPVSEKKRRKNKSVGLKLPERSICETSKMRTIRNVATTKATEMLVSVSVPSHELKKQGNYDFTMDKSQGINEVNKKQLRGKKHMRASSMHETMDLSLSEKPSVTGIISRYFFEFDEVNSFSSPLGVIRDNLQSTKEVGGVQRFGDIQQNETYGSMSHSMEFLADGRDPQMRDESDSETVCSRNITSSNPKKLECSLAYMRKKTYNKQASDFIMERGGPSTMRTQKEANSFVVTEEHKCSHANKWNKACRSRKLVHRKVNKFAPHSTSRMMSPHLKFAKDVRVSSSKTARIEVGRHLVQAANQIGLSSGWTKSPISRFVSRYANLTSSNTGLLVRSFSFEASDSDG